MCHLVRTNSLLADFPADRCLEEIEDIAQLAVTRGWRGLKQCVLDLRLCACAHVSLPKLLDTIFLYAISNPLWPLGSQGEFCAAVTTQSATGLTHVL